MAYDKRASHDEIFLHLQTLLGNEAVSVSLEVAHLAIAGDQETALTQLIAYDKSLESIGVWYVRQHHRKPPGIYRAFYYVYLPLESGTAFKFQRFMIHSACSYLEELLKKIVRLWPWEVIKADRIPLGALVKKIEKRLPPSLAAELIWLSQGIYNFAKHHFNFEDEDEEPKHFFELDEAIAVYLIVRKLGRELEIWSGKPLDKFTKEY